MDYDDTFFSAPVRYAVEELDSDEELEMDTQEKTIHTNVDASMTDITLVLGPTGPGQVYIDSLSDLTKVGTITCSVTIIRIIITLNLVIFLNIIFRHKIKKKQRPPFFNLSTTPFYIFLFLKPLLLKKQCNIPNQS